MDTVKMIDVNGLCWGAMSSPELSVNSLCLWAELENLVTDITCHVVFAVVLATIKRHVRSRLWRTVKIGER